MFEKTIVLDTCALLWLANGSDKLSETARNQIDHASIVYVSAISAWEISLKHEKEMLILPLNAEQWFSSVIEKHSLVLFPLDVSILCAANRLPLHHKDPADRMIIATAIRESAAVVTADFNFKKYDVKVIV
ncbi:MAG: type II toxin-antitoxin system VapC family toxin [Spirochaetales bacterium]|nr:type II toxin-antitoxin system VapC family toxin [Spirochaetales bacterium]